MRRTEIANPIIDIHDIENRLWASADELRANSGLKESEYSVPMLGLIFLKYADSRFSAREAELAGGAVGRRTIGKADFQAKGVMYLPEQAPVWPPAESAGGGQPGPGGERRHEGHRG